MLCRYVPVEELFESLNKIEEMMKSDDTDNGCPTHDKLSFAAGKYVHMCVHVYVHAYVYVSMNISIIV